MTPEQIALVQASAARLADQLPDVSGAFYRRLFTYSPELQSMFSGDPVLQQRKFADSLAAIVAAIPDFESFAARAADLGEIHARHRVTSTHYPVVGAALLSALAEADPRWDSRTSAAWEAAYDLLAESMMMASRPTRPSRVIARRPSRTTPTTGGTS